MFAGTRLPEGVMVTTPHLAANSSITVTGDVTYVMYHFTYPMSSSFSLHLENSADNDLRSDCGISISGEVDLCYFEDCNDSPTDGMHEWYNTYVLLRINGSAIEDNETVLVMCKVLDSDAQPFNCNIDTLVIKKGEEI